jgi:hypothetical protein
MMFYPLEQLYLTQINKIIQTYWEDRASNKLDQHRLADQQILIFPSPTAHLQVGLAGLELDLVLPIQVLQLDSPQPLTV